MLRIFSHYIPTTIVILILVELVVLFFSVYLGVFIRFIDSQDIASDIASVEPIHIKAGYFTFVMWLCMNAFGLHTRNIVNEFSGLMIRIILSFVVGFLIISLTFYIFPDLILSRGIFAYTIMVSFMGVIITRTIFQKIDNHRIFKRNILVLGVGEKAKILENQMENANKQGFEIVGFVNINTDDNLVDSKYYLKIESTLLDLCNDHDVDEIVLALDDRRKSFPMSGLLECKMKGIIVRDLVDALERITGHIQLEALHPSTVIFSEGFTNAVTMSMAKRIFDVTACIIILVLTSPFIILTAIAIWLSSFGKDPIFYRQIRVGLCDAPFGVLKFRSMRTDAEKSGAQFASKNDSRVTKIGSFIRKTRIDELPQLLNVLKGDMSFIGPRPERPQFVLGYEQTISHYGLRHTVKPGITGWAQICYPYGETDEDTKNKLQYDLYYIKNYSLFLDMTILFQTIQVVLFGQGAR